jgi:Cupin-like domain
MRTLQPADRRLLEDELLRSTEPVLLRGLVADWPAVQAAQRSAADGIGYLRGFDAGATVGAWFGAPEIAGHFFYSADFTGFNFEPRRLKLAEVLDELERWLGQPRPPAVYMGSTTLDTSLPGFRAHNDVPQIAQAGFDALASIWIGNPTRIAAHHDVPDNLACVVAGRRRFTLFPPDEVANLYVGPLDFTPAGQAVSLVDIMRPDLQRFPRYAQAQARAQVVELQAGDALFIPSLWWHHVEALDGFNVLVNYWWRQSPAHMDTPMNALLMALLSVRDLPDAQRQAAARALRARLQKALNR